MASTSMPAKPSLAKRSSFPRRRNDAYDTPAAAVLPLLPHLEPESFFIEPCAGASVLVRHLMKHDIICFSQGDVVPRDPEVMKLDAGKVRLSQYLGEWVGPEHPRPRYFITNPPWTRELLHPIIFNLFWQLPTWLLLDADWMHTVQAGPYMALCRKIVSVGRVRWMEGQPEDKGHSPKDNCAWYLFAAAEPPVFIARRA